MTNKQKHAKVMFNELSKLSTAYYNFVNSHGNDSDLKQLIVGFDLINAIDIKATANALNEIIENKTH